MTFVKCAMLIFSLFAGSAAMAFPKHLFWCGSMESEPMKQVYFEIEDTAVKTTGVGTVYISELSQSAPINTGWQVQTMVSAKAEMLWSSKDGVPFISAIKIDMGKSGMVSAAMVGDIKIFNSKGHVVSNLMNFNFPDGKDFTYCSYFLALSPKPGMVGSN